MSNKKASEEGKAPVEAVEASEELITLGEYILRKQPNPGLVASFKAEAENDSVTARSLEQWDKDFDTQAKRVYK